MRRHVFPIAASLSLLLFIATAAAWAAPRDRYLPIWKNHATGPNATHRSVYLYRGQLRFESERGEESTTQPVSRLFLPRWMGVLGVRAGHSGGDFLLIHDPVFGDGPRTYWYLAMIWVSIHLLTILVLTAILPLWWLARRPRPYPKGFCARCGYDLRASAERCPECGRAAERTTV